MAVEFKDTVAGEVVQQVTGTTDPQTGTAGMQTQLPGSQTTVSGVANATGGIADGNLMDTYVDEQLFLFQGDDTPLMQLALKAKKVKVDSPVVKHSMMDEPKYKVTTTSASSAGNQAVLQLSTAEQKYLRPFDTALCKGVNGYDETGQTEKVGEDLMVFVTGIDPTTANPIVVAINGPKANATDDACTIPAIPAGTDLVMTGNACYETQKNVDPEISVPKFEEVYLQKRIMNRVVSDYFAAQRKKIPGYTEALLAEAAIRNYKTKTNRSYWAGQKGKFNVMTPKTGLQTVYLSKGILWMFRRIVMRTGAWTYDEFIALAKLYYTGEDVPKTGICLCGKNVLEAIQKIDWSKHPEVRIEQKTNNLGWSVTHIHTVFGDFDFKREPTLDRLGYSNSFAILGEDRIVRYVYSNEHSFNEKIEGEEATRSGIITWDTIALKGGCHMWIDGEGDESDVAAGTTGDGETTRIVILDCVPDNPLENVVYYFTEDVALTDELTALNGTMWVYKGGEWSAFTGVVDTTSATA